MPGKMKDKVKKPNPMKMTQMRNGKETMKKMRNGKKTKVMKAGLDTNKTMVKKNRGKKLMMQSQNPQIEGFQDYVKRMFGGGQS